MELLGYIDSASKNNREAQNVLGVMYRDGQGTKQNYVKALHYFEKSAQQDYNVAIMQLGFMYKLGLGVRQNYKKAFQHFKRASDLNCTKAKYELAEAYINGLGVDKNISKAKNVLRILNANDDKKAKEIWKKYNLNKLDNVKQKG
ncbi:MAG: tetratricopeptide repeat protein [Campylobacterota bacterium]|nr:tetratricopeptide repeat protein [Campylobacterota bacterium]